MRFDRDSFKSITPTIFSKYFRHTKRQPRVEPLITGDDALVLHVESNAARHLENSLRSADRPSRLSVAAVVGVAPHSKIGVVACQRLIGWPVRRQNELFWRIDGEG